MKLLTAAAAASLMFATTAMAGGCTHQGQGEAKMTPASYDGKTAGAEDKSYDTMKAEKADIVDTAVAAGSFNTLVAAVGAADLVATLKSEGPFTVFAPTDEAFAALPEGTVASLLLPENKAQLQAILTYHVVPGKVKSKDLAGQVLDAETVQGASLAIDATDGVVVNGANVVQADVWASNGVIHVIDAVLLPPTE